MKKVEGQLWPEGRSSHSAACLGYGSDHPQLLVTGGTSIVGLLGDAWILDFQSVKWREVRAHSYKIWTIRLGGGGGEIKGIQTSFSKFNIKCLSSTHPQRFSNIHHTSKLSVVCVVMGIVNYLDPILGSSPAIKSIYGMFYRSKMQAMRPGSCIAAHPSDLVQDLKRLPYLEG